MEVDGGFEVEGYHCAVSLGPVACIAAWMERDSCAETLDGAAEGVVAGSLVWFGLVRAGCRCISGLVDRAGKRTFSTGSWWMRASEAVLMALRKSQSK